MFESLDVARFSVFPCCFKLVILASSKRLVRLVMERCYGKYPIGRRVNITPHFFSEITLALLSKNDCSSKLILFWLLFSFTESKRTWGFVFVLDLLILSC